MSDEDAVESFSPGCSTFGENQDEEFCEVCHVPAHGIHFGVVSCRACAAFFRRTVVTNRQKKYLCRKDNDSCLIKPEDRCHCRRCRYNKCIELGMTPKNVQIYRDSFRSSKKPPKKVTKVSLVKMKNREHPLQTKPKRIIDVTGTKNEIIKILCDNPFAENPEFLELNKLEQAEFALRNWRDQQLPEERMEHLELVTIKHLFGIFKTLMLTIAKWLSHSQDFQNFEKDQKYKFFKLVWNIWRKFERYQMSLEMFGEEAVTREKFPLTNQHLVSDTLRLDFSQVSEETTEKLTIWFKKTWRDMFQQVSDTLIELKPTSTEMAFMLCELCWQVAGKEMQNGVLEVSERVRDELGNNLHTYFRQNEHIVNYASRLIKLTKIVNTIIKFHTELKSRMDLAHIFDVFHVELSEPDLYDC